MGSPLPSEQVRPTTFETKVLNVRYSLRTTPLNTVFISGMPEPIACGAMICTKPDEKRISVRGNAIHARYCNTGCLAKSRYNQIRAKKQ